MKIQMKRDIAFSYKYNWLLKGDSYVVEDLPKEMQDKVRDWIKAGLAVVVAEEVATQVLTDNARVIQLEKQLKEEEEKAVIDAERAVNSRKARKIEVNG